MREIDTIESEETKVDTVAVPEDFVVTQRKQIGIANLLGKLRSFIASQKARLRSLSALVIVDFVTSGLGFFDDRQNCQCHGQGEIWRAGLGTDTGSI